MIEPNSHVGQGESTLYSLYTAKIAILRGLGVPEESHSFDSQS